MTVNIPPTVLPTKKPNRQRFRRPWNIDPSCVLALMPEVNSTWRDYSLEANHVVLTSATKVYNCRFGDGIYFDGIDDAITATVDPFILIGLSDFTCEAWVKTTDITTDNGILSNRNTAGWKGINWTISGLGDAGELRIEMTDDDGNHTALLADTPLIQDTWNHAVFAADRDGDGAFYLNGVADGGGDISASDATLAATIAFTIGARTRAPYDIDFEGYIDELRIYNRLLAAWEVRALYEQGRPGGV